MNRSIPNLYVLYLSWKSYNLILTELVFWDGRNNVGLNVSCKN